MIEKPVFLVGAERSGTTLLRLMLKHHPDISWLKEFEYSVDLVTDKGAYPSLNSYYEYLESDRIFRSTGLTIDKTLSYSELVNDFLEQQRALDQKLLIGATVHRHFDRLLYIWPDAQFIHLIRDPRDVARSSMGMGWAGNVWHGVERWIEAETTWNQLITQISVNRYIEIGYEDLIRQPEKTLTSICQFLNLTYHNSMLDYDQDSTYSKPNAELIEQWRKKLSQSEIQLVESKVGDLLTQKEYQSSGLPNVEIDSFTKQQLSLQNWWYKINFRIKRFGLPLVISEYLSRKLRLKLWEKQNRLKMAKITTQYLK